MDYQDFLILSELMKNPFETYENMGLNVGMRGVSVRARMLKMKETGFLQGIYLIPSPLNFDRSVSTCVFTRVKDASLKLMDIITVKDVAFAWTDHENDVVVNMYYRSDEERVNSLSSLSEILGDNAVSIFTPMSLLPPMLSSSGLSSIDWKIMEHIVSEPRASTSELSRLTHLSRNTVEMHRKRFISDRLVYPVFISDFTRSSGNIFYGAVVFFEHPGSLKQLIGLGMIPVWSMTEPTGAHFLGFAESLRDVELVKNRVKDIEGVTEFSISIPSGGIFAVERVKHWIRNEIKYWKLASLKRT